MGGDLRDMALRRGAGRGLRKAAAAAAGIGIAAASLALLTACADPARERFERAEKAFLEQRMDGALDAFRSVPRDFPQSRYAPAALLRQGDLYGSFYRNYEAALEAYDSLVFNYPQSAEVPAALLRKAEIRLLQFFDYPAAVADLERVRRLHPRFEKMDEVLILLAKGYGGLSDPSRQIAVLGELIEKHPGSPRVAEARWMSGYALLAQERFADADREFRKLLYLAADRKEAARARWGVAQALEGEGSFALALKEYEAIGEDGEDPDYLKEKIRRLRTLLRRKP